MWFGFARVGLWLLSRGLDAAKSEMVATGSDLTFPTRADHVTSAILVRAKERAATMHTFLLRRFGRIKRRFRTLRISDYLTGFGDLRVVIGPIPIAAPLPDVTGHVIEAVGVWGKGSGRCQSREAVFTRVLDRKLTLIGVRHELASGFELVAPGIEFAGHAAARCEFPLRFAGQPFPGPLGVSLSIVHRYFGNRIVILLLK